MQTHSIFELGLPCLFPTMITITHLLVGGRGKTQQNMKNGQSRSSKWLDTFCALCEIPSSSNTYKCQLPISFDYSSHAFKHLSVMFIEHLSWMQMNCNRFLTKCEVSVPTFYVFTHWIISESFLNHYQNSSSGWLSKFQAKIWFIFIVNVIIAQYKLTQ